MFLAYPGTTASKESDNDNGRAEDKGYETRGV